MTAAALRIVGVVTIVMACATVARAQQLDAPTNLQASINGSHVVITWKVASADAADGFRLEAGSGPGLADLAIVNIPWHQQQGAPRFDATGVAPGTYYLRVRAMHGQVLGAPSAEISMRVGASSCPLPAAPRNVVATVANALVTLSWESSVSGGTLGYVIEAGTRPGAPDVAIITMDTTSLSINAPPGRYFVRVRTMGLCGGSEPSPEVDVIVP